MVAHAQSPCLVLTVCALLAVSAEWQTCLALPPPERALSHYPLQQQSHHEGLLRLLHFVIYACMAVSSVLLVASAGAILQMPTPHCLCYTVPRSDVAMCFGMPCCSCANIRQANLTLVLLWTLMLLCELALGIELLFVYPFLGFCLLHILAFTGAHMLMRNYQRQDAALAEAAAAASRLPLGLEGSDGAPGVMRRQGRGGPAASPPPIHTMSAELVLVLQPDYELWAGGGRGCEDGGAGGGERVPPLRQNSSLIGLSHWYGGGAAADRGAERGGSADCDRVDGSGGYQGARGGGSGSDAYTSKACSGGVAWALRYTRVDPPAASGNAQLAKLSSESPRLPGRRVADAETASASTPAAMAAADAPAGPATVGPVALWHAAGMGHAAALAERSGAEAASGGAVDNYGGQDLGSARRGDLARTSPVHVVRRTVSCGAAPYTPPIVGPQPRVPGAVGTRVCTRGDGSRGLSTDSVDGRRVPPSPGAWEPSSAGRPPGPGAAPTAAAGPNMVGLTFSAADGVGTGTPTGTMALSRRYPRDRS